VVVSWLLKKGKKIGTKKHRVLGIFWIEREKCELEERFFGLKYEVFDLMRGFWFSGHCLPISAE